MLNDIRYGFRYVAKMFRTEFGPTVVTVLTLALAIGANTAVFGVTKALLTDVPPIIENPNELVNLTRTVNGRIEGALSYPSYLEYRNQTDLFTGVAAFNNSLKSVGLSTPFGAETAPVALVSGNYFDVLGIRPQIGRVFSLDDERLDAPDIAVVSHRVWATHFKQDPGIIGKSITLNGKHVPVAGVAPREFHGADLRTIDVWIPLTSTLTLIDGNTPQRLLNQTAGWLAAVGRLNPGVDAGQAQARLNVVAQRLAEAQPDRTRNIGVAVLSYRMFPADIRSLLGTFLSGVMVVAILLLIIACANVAGIGLARAAMRKREIAVRLAVGASRRRVIRLLLTETLVLFAMAAGLGVVFAQWADVLVESLRARVSFITPIEVSTDFRVILFTIGLTAVAALISGLTPALHGTRRNIATAVKEDSGSTTFRRSRLRNGLVIAQVTLSFILLFTGSLFLRTLMSVASTDLGFNPENVQVVALDFSLAGLQNAESSRLENDLLSRVTAIPGVDSASFAVDLPVDQNAFGLAGINVPGYEPPPGRTAFAPLWNIVSPGYFRTLGIPLLQGRDFDSNDRDGSVAVAIINETMAAQFWSGTEAVGKTFYVGSLAEGRPVQVIGIAKNVNTRSINENPSPFIYVPYAQSPNTTHGLILRTAPGADVVPAVRKIVRELNPNLPVGIVRSMNDVVGFGLVPQRLAAWIAGIMGLAGTLLAGLGIYGVTSYSVSSRTREIGIRVALGAEPGRVVRLIAREGMVLAAIGFGLGTMAAFALAQLVRTFLYVAPANIVAFGAAAAAMATAALLASYLPSRRATRVDPMVALRHD